jgi:hypothetical protein
MPRLCTQAWLTWRDKNGRRCKEQMSHGEVEREDNWKQICQERLYLRQPHWLSCERKETASWLA